MLRFGFLKIVFVCLVAFRILCHLLISGNDTDIAASAVDEVQLSADEIQRWIVSTTSLNSFKTFCAHWKCRNRNWGVLGGGVVFQGITRYRSLAVGIFSKYAKIELFGNFAHFWGVIKCSELPYGQFTLQYIYGVDVSVIVLF